MKQSTDELLENEWFIVRHSGETPEIAFHSAIYFLTQAKQGPRIRLSEEHITWLKDGAVERFREIVLRDLQHANADKPMYRGVARSIVNYQRFKKFCTRQNLCGEAIKRDTAKNFLSFVVAEVAELQSGSRATLINCSFAELIEFAEELKVSLDSYQRILQVHCG